MLFKPSLQSTIRIKRSKKHSLNTKISQIKSIITKPKFFGGFAVSVAILPLLVFGVGYLKSVYAESQWIAEDFTYKDTTITGFSDSGAEKIKLIKTLYLPDENPNGQNITAIKDFTILQDQDNPKAFMKKGITFLKLPAHIEIIGQEAFLDNEITNINLPTTTRIIQTSAFAQNQLTSLNLPDSITTIVNSSFRQNKITGTLTIPKDVTEIGEAAFADNQISTLVLNDKITAIDAQAFEKNRISQIKVHNQASQQFPTTLTSLGTGAFKDNQLASVTLPAVISKLADEAFMNNKLTQFNSFANLTEIGAGAFEGNQFVNIDLSTVTKIHERAFKQNYALRSVVTSPNLSVLGDEAFYNTRLEKINLPNTVTSIAPNTFKRATSYLYNNNYFKTTTYVYTTNNQNVNNYPRQGDGFMVDVVDVLTHYYIKDTTTKLREDSKLTAKIGVDLVLTDTSTYFKSDHYDNITDTIVAADGKTYKLVNTPNQITSTTTELDIYYQEYQVSNDWETDDFVWEGTTIKGFTEKGTAKSHILTTLTFPNNSANQGVTAIANEAFKEKLNKINKLKIPATLQKIGAAAFVSNQLTNIDFSEAHNLHIGGAAFRNNKLTKLNLPTGAGLTFDQYCGGGDDWGIFSHNKTLTEVTLPQDMTTVPSCFLSHSGVKSITIPASVTTIGEKAFYGYYLDEDQKLTNLTFTPGSQLTTIGHRAFFKQGLTTVNLPNTVTTIGGGAFGYNKLTKVKLPESNLTLGFGAFSKNLITEIIFPTHHTVTLGGGAFSGNKLVNLDLSQNAIKLEGNGNFEDNQIVNLKLPANIQEIPRDTFASNKLTSLKIPSTLRKIDGWAFRNNQLTNIDFSEAHNLHIGQVAFHNNKLTKLNLPTGAGLTFDQDCYSYYGFANGGIFGSNPTLTEVTLPQDMTTIPGCFLSGSGVKSITIPASVTTIGEKAFYGYYLDEDQKLTNLTFAPGSQLTTIGGDAFAGQRLTTVDFPNTVTTIGNYAFAGNKLTTITLSESLTKLPYDVFANNKLTGVLLPNSITTIDQNAFRGNVGVPSVGNKVLLFTEKRDHNYSNSDYHVINANNIKVSYTQNGQVIKNRVLWRSDYKSNQFITIDNGYEIVPEKRFSHNGRLYVLENDQPVSVVVTEHTNDVEFKYRLTQGYKVNYYLEGTTSPVPGIDPSSVFHEVSPGSHQVNLPTVPNYAPVPGQNTTVNVGPMEMKEINIYYRGMVGYTVSYYIQDNQGNQTTTPVPGISPSVVTGSGLPGTDIDITHPTAGDNYVPVAGQPTKATLQADPSKNNFRIYYQKRQANYTIKYVIDGTNQPVPELTDVTGQAPVDSTVNIPHPDLDNYQVVAGQPNNFVVKADPNQNIITVRYRHKGVGYKISYVDQDGNLLTGLPTNPITGSAAIDSSVTINHPTVAGYQIMPNQPTSLVIKADANQNQVTVKYRRQAVSYKISYVDQDGNLLTGLPTNPITGSAPIGSSVTINHPTVAGYQIESNQPTSLIIKANANQNQVTIRYRKLVGYKISYVDQDNNLITSIPNNPITGKKPLGETVTINHPTVAGYQIEPNQPTSLVIKADANQNQVTIKYRRQAPTPTQVGYQVTYLLQGTNQPVPGINPHQINSQGLPGTKITIVYPVLEQYEPIDGQPTELTLQANATNNQLTVYYRQKPQQPTPNPDPTPTPNPNPDPTPTPQPQPTPGGNGQSQPNNNALLPPNSGFETKTASVITAVSIIMGVASALKLYASRRR